MSHLLVKLDARAFDTGSRDPHLLAVKLTRTRNHVQARGQAPAQLHTIANGCRT